MLGLHNSYYHTQPETLTGATYPKGMIHYCNNYNGLCSQPQDVVVMSSMYHSFIQSMRAIDSYVFKRRAEGGGGTEKPPFVI